MRVPRTSGSSSSWTVGRQPAYPSATMSEPWARSATGRRKRKRFCTSTASDPDEGFPRGTCPELPERAERFERPEPQGHKACVFTPTSGCRDIDDALSARFVAPEEIPLDAMSRLPCGLWQAGGAGVHIADVTHFLKPNTAMDLEARGRTSVYLVDRRIDMLPAADGGHLLPLARRGPVCLLGAVEDERRHRGSCRGAGVLQECDPLQGGADVPGGPGRRSGGR